MNIQNKIRKRKAIIGIIGLGYVGLPLFVNFIKSNFKVYGFDIDKKKIKSLNKGISYINHVDFNFINNQDICSTFMLVSYPTHPGTASCPWCKFRPSFAMWPRLSSRRDIVVSSAHHQAHDSPR